MSDAFYVPVDRERNQSHQSPLIVVWEAEPDRSGEDEVLLRVVEILFDAWQDSLAVDNTSGQNFSGPAHLTHKP